MSIRGFNVGTGVEQYDYNYLDNLPGGEVFTSTEKAKLGALPTATELNTELGDKVETDDVITTAQIDALFT